MSIPASETRTNALLMGAAVVAVASTSYLGFVNFLCCIGLWGGGMFAVYRYTTDTQSTITGGDGAQLGFMAGLIGAVIGLVLTFVLRLVGIRDDLVISNMMLNMQGMPPEALDQIAADMEKTVVEKTLTWGALIGPLVSGAVGAIGGAIGAAVFKKGGSVRPEQTY